MARNNSQSAQLDSWTHDRLAALDPSDQWQPNTTAAFARLRQLQSTRTFTATRLTVIAALAAATCICIAALPSPKVFAHRCLECTLAAWQSIAPSGAGQASLKPRDGRALAPDFTLKDANEKDVKLSDLKGKVVLVNFWATWCEGCQVEIPWFVEFEKKYESRGLVVIGISMDDDGWKSVKPWLEEKKVNYPIVIGNDPLSKQYGLKAMPLTALVDRNGNIADTHAGLVNKSATEQRIRSLLKEKPAN